jgi:hypothetical protein
MAGFPAMLNTGPGAFTVRIGVTVPPRTRARTAAGTVVTWLTTPCGAGASLAAAAVPEANLIATNPTTIASTAPTAAIDTSHRRRAWARCCAARWAAIRCRARTVPCERRGWVSWWRVDATAVLPVNGVLGGLIYYNG